MVPSESTSSELFFERPRSFFVVVVGAGQHHRLTLTKSRWGHFRVRHLFLEPFYRAGIIGVPLGSHRKMTSAVGAFRVPLRLCLDGLSSSGYLFERAQRGTPLSSTGEWNRPLRTPPHF
jgi:hypothetical protein